MSHEYDECSDEVTLIFRGNDELVLSCTRRGFAVLRDAVADANRDLITRAVRGERLGRLGARAD